MSRFNVGDSVWVIRNNAPEKMTVYAVVNEAGFICKRRVDIWYKLCDGYFGASFDSRTYRYGEDAVFATKDELIDHLRAET